MRAMKPWMLCAALLLAACARSSTSRAARSDAPGVSFKTSPTLLLEHRAELALTPAQVDRLEKLEFSLQEKNRPLQVKLDTLRTQRQKNSTPWHGGYQGGGSHDVYGGKGGDMTGPPEAAREKQVRRERLSRIDATLRAMQDNDSQAYVEAEGALTEAQRPRARELFSQEREGLLKQLETMHHQLRKEDY